MTYAVTTQNLERRFGSFVAVRRLTLAVKEGEIFGFLGANGAGKTTAIRMLCGLLLPTSGNAAVGGYDVWTETERIKQSIGYMSQKFSLYNDLTLAENIEFYGGIYGLKREAIRNKQKELLSSLGLVKDADRLTRDMPLGFKQRLALGCALLHDPRIIFLDEPTGGVDPDGRREFWELIHNLADAGKTVFVTTHYMDEAEYCNRISIMFEGEIIAMDTPAVLKKKIGKNTMEDVFIELVRR